MWSQLNFTLAANIITKCARESLIIEILYADDLVLISESMENLTKNFLKWKKVFGSKNED